MTSTAIVENVSLETQRLILREIEESDRASLYNYWSDPEVARYMPRGPLSEESVKSLVQRVISERQNQPRRYFRLAIISKQGGRFLGDCVCRVSNPENREDLSTIIGQAYIGFFFNKAFWGHGYATEVARTLLRFGLEQLGLVRIWAWCDTENLAFARVLEKVGMRREAHFRKSVMVQGNWARLFCLRYPPGRMDPLTIGKELRLTWKTRRKKGSK